MREIELRIEVFRNALMLGKFLAIVSRQRMHPRRKRRQQGDHGLGHCLRCFANDFANERVARLAFVERHQGLLLAGADDQVTLPVAKAKTPVHDGGTQFDRDLVGDGAAALAIAVAFLALLLAAQIDVQPAAGALVGIDALIDAFVTDRGQVMDLEVTADLFRAPLLLQFGLGKEPGVGRHATAVLSGPHAGPRELLRLLRAVTALTAVALELATDGRFAALKHARNRALVMTGLAENMDLVAFG